MSKIRIQSTYIKQFIVISLTSMTSIRFTPLCLSDIFVTNYQKLGPVFHVRFKRLLGKLCYVYLNCLFSLFQWHICKLAKISACIAKCITTINKIYIFTSQINLSVISSALAYLGERPGGTPPLFPLYSQNELLLKTQYPCIH